MRIEIAHDALAKKVYEKGSSEDKMLLRVIRLVKERYGAFGETNTHLSRKELNLIEPFEKDLQGLVDSDAFRFINKSSKFRRRQTLALIIGIATVMVGLIAGMIYSNQLRMVAEKAENEIREKNKANTLVAQAMQNEEISPEFALKLVLAAKKIRPSDVNIDKLSRLIFRRNTFANKQMQHRGGVMGVSFSPDGKTFATGSIDKIIRIWDVKGNLLKTFQGHTRVVNGIDFSPDGKFLVSSSDDSTAIIWDVATGDSVKMLTQHTSDINDVKYSPDGKYILTGSRDRTAILWNSDGTFYKRFEGHIGNIYKVAFAQKSNDYIATASRDSTVIVWNVNTGRAISTLKHPDFVYGVAFSTKDVNKIATGCRDDLVRIWNLNSPSKPIHVLDGHTGTIKNVVFSPSGDTLASSSWDYTIKLWDVKEGININTFVGHSNYAIGLDYHPKGSYVLSGSDDKTARIWNLSLRRNIRNFDAHRERVQTVAFSEDGNLSLTGSWDNTFKLWNVNTKQEVFSQTLENDIESVTFHPSNQEFAVATGKNILIYNIAKDLKVTPKNNFKGHLKTVKTVKYSKNGKYLLSGGRDNKAILWTSDGRKIHELKTHTDNILSVDFSTTDDTIATSSWDGSIALWDLESGTLLQKWLAHDERIYSISFHPKEAMMISGGMDGSIKLWLTDWTTKKLYLKEKYKDKEKYKENYRNDFDKIKLYETFRTSNYIYSLQFVPNGDGLFLSGGGDNQARLWNIEGEVLQIYNHASDVYSVATNDQMSYVLTGTRDNGAGLYFTLEGFLEDNHFEEITLIDSIEFNLIDISDFSLAVDQKDLMMLRNLAGYLVDEGTKLNSIVHFEKAQIVYDRILEDEAILPYDKEQAGELYAKLAFAKIVKSRSNDSEARRLIDEAYKLAPINGEVILDKAHIESIKGNEAEAWKHYQQLKTMTYAYNRSMLPRARGELRNLRSENLISEAIFDQLIENLSKL